LNECMRNALLEYNIKYHATMQSCRGIEIGTIIASMNQFFLSITKSTKASSATLLCESGRIFKASLALFEYDFAVSSA